jgi:serine/threonine protein kinase
MEQTWKSLQCVLYASQPNVLCNFCFLDYSELLWTAPELLRLLFNSHQTKNISIQKADIYSFGITLQEIVVRGAPFEGSDLTSAGKTLLRRIKRKRCLFFAFTDKNIF